MTNSTKSVNINSIYLKAEHVDAIMKALSSDNSPNALVALEFIKRKQQEEIAKAEVRRLEVEAKKKAKLQAQLEVIKKKMSEMSELG